MSLSLISNMITVFVIIISGYILSRMRFFPHSFWPQLGRLSYWIFLPAFLAFQMSHLPLTRHQFDEYVLVLVLGTVFLFALLWLLFVLWRPDAKALLAISQGAIRLDVFVALSIVGGVLGRDGLHLASVAVLVLIPLMNICSLCFVLIYDQRSDKKIYERLKEYFLYNPALLSIFAGIVLRIFRMGEFPMIQHGVHMMAGACLPISLLVVGSSLNWDVLRAKASYVVVPVCYRLIISPLVFFVLCYVLDVRGASALVIAIFVTSPSDLVGSALVRISRGDINLAAGIITVEVFGALLALPAVMCVFNLLN